MKGSSLELAQARAPTDPSLGVDDVATPTSGQGRAEAPPRQRIGRYELLQEIGVGGMGVVYAAYDRVLDRQVAIKLVRGDRRDAISPARMIREGRALARLAHPNVVAVHEVSDFAGQIYLVMEYVKGTTLRQWTAGSRSIAEIVDMFLQAGRGLAAAHAEGLVHRDFKPDNVLIGSDGRARVVDFGLVADPSRRGDEPGEEGLAAVEEAPLTRTGALPGTPAYMAPELFAGRPADARSDQFSFCVALHEALCGERPFAGASTPRVAEAARAGAIRPAPRGVPGWLHEVVRRGLSPEPGRRWPSMGALLAALAADPRAAWRRRLRLGLAALAASAVVLAIYLGGAELRLRWTEARREQETQAQRAAVEARIAAARARGDRAAAARTFEDFVGDPRVRETAALADAWIAEGQRRVADDHLTDAASAHASAFVRARGDAQRLAALDGLAAILRAQYRWGPLREVLATTARIDPEAAATPRRRSLAVEAALGERDLSGALALLGPGESTGIRGLLGGMVGAALETEYDDVLHVDRVDLEGDGVAELMLQRIRPGGIGVDIVRADPTLELLARGSVADVPPPTPSVIRALAPDRDGRLLLLGSSNDEQVLLEIDADRLRVRARWAEGHTSASAVGDLDGDGVDEIYTGTSPATRRIVELIPDDAGGFTPRDPIAPGEAPASDVHGLLIADLDGDGRRELVVADGPWRAYDVRVYRRDAEGRLRLVDRAQLGSVVDVVTIQQGGRTLVAAVHVAAYPSRLVFPIDRPTGAPPGVYFFGLEDDRLVLVATMPLPMAADDYVYEAAIGGVGDLDGDGRDDLALVFARNNGRNTVFGLQRADGGFTAVHVGGASVLALTELDGDPAPEILAVLGPEQSRGKLWILGAGDQAMPRAEAPRSTWPWGQVLGDAGAGPWSRPLTLRAMGLHAEAAQLFEEIAGDAEASDLRARAALAAASERELDGDDRRAAEQFQRASVSPAIAEAAARGAFRTRLRLGEYGAAADALEVLLGDDRVADRAALEATRARLEPIARGEAEVRWTFGGAIDDAWTLGDPLALRRDPTREALVVDVVTSGDLLSMPIELIGDTLEIELDVSLEVMEFSAGIHVVVTDDAGEQVAGLYAVSTGGGRQVRRLFHCHFNRQPLAPGQRSPIDPATLHERVRLRVGAVGPLQQSHCLLDRNGREPGSVRRDLDLLSAPPGRYRLTVRAFPTDGPALLRGAIHGITLRGARPLVDVGPIDREGQAIRRAIIDGDPLAAAALLRARGDRRSALERLWSADLRLRAGDVEGARAELAEVLRRIEQVDASGPADAESIALAGGLHTLLRRDGALYGPVLASISSQAHRRRFIAAWTNAVSHHIDESPVQEGVLEVLGRLDLAPAGAASDAEIGDAVTLLTWRALARARTRRGAEARADLEEALALTSRAAGDPELWARRRRDLLVELAAQAIAAGDPSGARARAIAALEACDEAIFTRDLLRARDGLAPIVDAIGR
ncbi:MAG: protein kinase [Nannocystaceae bacterium]